MKKIFFAIILCFSTKAFCMVCVDSNNSVSNIVNISEPVLVSESASIGDVIWSSDTITTNVTCSIGPGEIRDHVNVYPFPTFDKSQLPSGISMRLIINGVTIEQTVVKQLLTPTDDWTITQNRHTGDITSQLVLVKSANTIENKNLGTIPLYQLDGGGGLNGANSLRVSLSGLSNIVGTTCTSTFNKVSENSSLLINDDLINSGTTTAAIANLAVSCTPVESVRNKTLNLSVLPSNSYPNENGLFKTNRTGLLYQLIVDTTSINAVTSDNNIPMILDSSGNGSLPVYQSLSLIDNTADWLYDENITTATSNFIQLTTEVKTIN
ncbi:TPA: hypothetical protein ACS7WR_003656 [Providencia alcalifaciens]